MANTTFDKNNKESPIVADNEHRIPFSRETSPGSDVFTDFYALPQDILKAFGIRLPQNTIRAKSQQDLIDGINATLTTILNQRLTIYKDADKDENDDNIIQTIGYKVGQTSDLFLRSAAESVNQIFDSAGVEPLLANADPLLPTADVTIEYNSRLFDDSRNLGAGQAGVNTLFDLVGGADKKVAIESNSRIIGWNSLGTVKGFNALSMSRIGLLNNNKGIISQDVSMALREITCVTTSLDPDIHRTIFSIFSPSPKIFNLSLSQFAMNDNENILWIDPKANANSSFEITDIFKNNLNVNLLKKVFPPLAYTLVTQKPVTFEAIFHVSNTFVVGQAVKLLDSTDPGYANIIGTITFASSTEFEVSGVFFTNDATGTITPTRFEGITGPGGNDAVFRAVNHGVQSGEPVYVKTDSGNIDTTGVGEDIQADTFKVKLADGTNIQFIDDVVGFWSLNSLGVDPVTGDLKSDPKILLQNNQNVPDTMVTGESGLLASPIGTPITVTITTIGVPVIIASGLWVSSVLENMESGPNGQLINKSKKSGTLNINFGGSLEKVGGGSVDVGFVLLQNGLLVGFNPPHTTNTGTIQIKGTDLLPVDENDTVDLAVINYLDTSNIEVTQASLVSVKAASS